MHSFIQAVRRAEYLVASPLRERAKPNPWHLAIFLVKELKHPFEHRTGQSEHPRMCGPTTPKLADKFLYIQIAYSRDYPNPVHVASRTTLALDFVMKPAGRIGFPGSWAYGKPNSAWNISPTFVAP